MARPTSKRKSDSALPTGKEKQRRTFASIRGDAPDSTGLEEQSNDELFVPDEPVAAKHVKKSNPKVRKSEPARVGSRTEEYEEDAGRSETQQFLALVELESKKKRQAAKKSIQYLEAFKKRVGDEEQALKANLQDLSAAAAKKDGDFINAFKAAYSLASPFQPPSTEVNPPGDSFTHRGFASMYSKSKELTAEALGLVARFDQVAQRVAELKPTGLMENEWAEEDSTAADLLAIGKRVGMNRYQSSLMASKEPPMDPDATQAAGFLYQGKRPGIWGKIARKQEKATRKLVDGLAVETD